MSTFYHGSPCLFEAFALTNAGDGTGIKFGYGIYLTESEASAVHYSQPRKCDLTPEHYLYTVEIPDFTEDNHLFSCRPVAPAIVAVTEQKLGVVAPDKVKALGKDFRKWVGCTLTGAKKAGFDEEKAAAEFFDSIGVIANVWPQNQCKPDGLRNCAIFNPSRVKITFREQIEIEDKKGKYVLLTRQTI